MLLAVTAARDRLIRGAFTTERLGCFKLIAGHFSVLASTAPVVTPISPTPSRGIVAEPSPPDQARLRSRAGPHDAPRSAWVSLGLRCARRRRGAVPSSTQPPSAPSPGDRALEELRRPRVASIRDLAEGASSPPSDAAPPLPDPRSNVDMRRRGVCRSRSDGSAYYVVAEALTMQPARAGASAVPLRASSRPAKSCASRSVTTAPAAPPWSHGTACPPQDRVRRSMAIFLDTRAGVGDQPAGRLCLFPSPPRTLRQPHLA